MKIIYNRTFVFGGLKESEKIFFLIPSIRISYINTHKDCVGLVFAFGFLFWEFVYNIGIAKNS